MCQAYRFFMSNDDDSKDSVIDDIKSELRSNSSSPATPRERNRGRFAELEYQKQDLDDEVRALEAVGREIPEVSPRFCTDP